MNFPLITAFTTSHRFWYVMFLFLFAAWYFYFIFDFFFDPLVVRECVGLFPHFYKFSSFPLVISFQFCATVAKKTLGMISIFLNLLRLIVWYFIWSILENVLCILEKNVHSTFSIWMVYICFLGLFDLKSGSSLMFPLDFLPSGSIHCWKLYIEVPYCHCIAYFSPFRFVVIWLKYLGAPILG